MQEHIVTIAERIVRAAEDEIATEWLNSVSVPSEANIAGAHVPYDYDWQDDYEASLAYPPIWRRVLERLRRLARRRYSF